MRLLVPTTTLTNQYNPALTCALKGVEPLALGAPQPLPGVMLLDSFLLGTERYRYPKNLPKVAATGGPQCMDLPNVGFGARPPFVVTDIDANPAQYGNQGILLNSDALKQALFGPLDGPPRNTARSVSPDERPLRYRDQVRGVRRDHDAADGRPVRHHGTVPHRVDQWVLRGVHRCFQPQIR